jgi:hypothetical protein
MIASSGDNVRISLELLVRHASDFPDDEPLIRRALTSLADAISWPGAINDLACRRSPLLPRQPPQIRRTKEPAIDRSVDDLEEVPLTIARISRLDRGKLRQMALDVGKECGIFPDNYTLRTRQHLIHWFASHLAVMELAIQSHPSFHMVDLE